MAHLGGLRLLLQVGSKWRAGTDGQLINSHNLLSIATCSSGQACATPFVPNLSTSRPWGSRAGLCLTEAAYRSQPGQRAAAASFQQAYLLGHLGRLAAHLTGTSKGAVHLTCSRRAARGQVSNERLAGSTWHRHGRRGAVAPPCAAGVPQLPRLPVQRPTDCKAATPLPQSEAPLGWAAARRAAAGQRGAWAPRRCCPSAVAARARPCPQPGVPAPPGGGMARGGRPRACASPMVAQMSAAVGKEAPRGPCKAGGATWGRLLCCAGDPGLPACFPRALGRCIGTTVHLIVSWHGSPPQSRAPTRPPPRQRPKPQFSGPRTSHRQ